MNFALTPYLFVLFLSVSVCWFIAFYSWRRHQITAANTFAFLMLSAGFWAFFYMLELVAVTLPTKLVFFNLKQLGASLIGPALLLFALRFTQQRIRYMRLVYGLLLIEPIATQVIFWTNSWHGLAGTAVLRTDIAPFPLLQFEFGAWYWLSIFIGYLLFAQATLIFVVRLPGANKVYRKQLGLLLGGFVFPWAVGTLGIFGVFNWQFFDVTTFVLWLSGAFIGYGMFRYQFLQLSPVAYSAVFSSIRDGIVVMDENGRISEINPAALHLLGLRIREALGQQIADILPIATTDFLQKREPNSDFNLAFFYEQGSQNRYLEVHGAKLVSSIYNTSGFVLILYDVTERKLAEKAWEFSENRYRTIFETDSAATIMIETDMIISLANERFAALSGYSRREIEGKMVWTRFVHEDDLPRLVGYHQSRREDGQTTPNEYEFRFITRSGAVKDVYISVALVPDSSVSIASLLDITDRKLAEKLLQQRATDLEAAVLTEQERSAILLQSISDAIALSDLNYKTIYVNQAFVRLTGYEMDELMGTPATFLLNGRLPEPIWQQLMNAMIDQKVWQGELQIKRKNGQAYDAAILIAPVYDGKKELIGYVSSHRDITEDKRLEESRRRFVTNISHELRTPVTNLKLYTDLLHRHFDSTRREHYFQVLEEQIERLERIIQNTLDISGLEDRRKTLQRELLHWQTLCDTLQIRLLPQANEKQIQLKFAPSILQLPSILGDAQRLSQALYELVHNAIVFTQPGGSVIISGAVQADNELNWITLSVQDNGPGIDSQEQAQVFDRFFRGQRAASGHIPGTGLGLSMVKLIAEAHNGRITIQSTPGQGSTFTLWLPLS
ncbi:MAG: PAS domain S-box protein [Chloroflexota bacterium]